MSGCLDTTICTATQWQMQPYSPSSDRVCGAHRVCTATEFQTREGTFLHNRVCQESTTCSSTEWESTPLTKLADRVCTPHTTCLGTEYETVAAGIILPPEEAKQKISSGNESSVHSGSSSRNIPLGSQGARLEHDSVTVLVSGDDGQAHVDIVQKLATGLANVGFHVVVVDESLIGEGIAEAFGFSSLEGRKRLVRNLQVAHVLNQFGIISLVPVEMADLRRNENALQMLDGEKYMIIETDLSKTDSKVIPITERLSAGEVPQPSNHEKDKCPLRGFTAVSCGAESLHHVIDEIANRVWK